LGYFYYRVRHNSFTLETHFSDLDLLLIPTFNELFRRTIRHRTVTTLWRIFVKYWIPIAIIGVLVVAIAATFLLEPPPTAANKAKQKERTKPTVSVGSQADAEVQPVAPAVDAGTTSTPQKSAKELDVSGIPATPELDGYVDSTRQQDANPPSPESYVIGLQIGAEAVAYPLEYFSSARRLFNDQVGGTKVAVLWDADCHTALAFSRSIDSRFTLLRERWMGSVVAADESTGSLWSPVAGLGIRGQHSGNSLTLLPIAVTTWKKWQTAFPATQVIAPPADSVKTEVAVAPSDQGAGFAVVVSDGAEATSVAFSELKTKGVVVANQTKIVLMFAPQASTVHAFRNQLDGKAMRFSISDQLIVDQDTQSTWEPSTGRATTGPLAGKTLERLPAFLVKSDVWAKLSGSGQSP
jgi:Protein of unknown function (DUF3179)